MNYFIALFGVGAHEGRVYMSCLIRSQSSINPLGNSHYPLGAQFTLPLLDPRH